MYSEEDLLTGCLKNDSKAQEEFYKRFAPKMYGVCLRFANNKLQANDILQEGFIKVFLNLSTFRREGSLEGWVRRTIINTAINLYKKTAKHLKVVEIDKTDIQDDREESVLDKMTRDELLKMINELPVGYRMVFNLNVMEGYSHKEIGELLKISENTSKSQLSRARQTLQKKLREHINKKP